MGEIVKWAISRFWRRVTGQQFGNKDKDIPKKLSKLRFSTDVISRKGCWFDQKEVEGCYETTEEGGITLGTQLKIQ